MSHLHLTGDNTRSPHNSIQLKCTIIEDWQDEPHDIRFGSFLSQQMPPKDPKKEKVFSVVYQSFIDSSARRWHSPCPDAIDSFWKCKSLKMDKTYIVYCVFPQRKDQVISLKRNRKWVKHSLRDYFQLWNNTHLVQSWVSTATGVIYTLVTPPLSKMINPPPSLF